MHPRDVIVPNSDWGEVLDEKEACLRALEGLEPVAITFQGTDWVVWVPGLKEMSMFKPWRVGSVVDLRSRDNEHLWKGRFDGFIIPPNWEHEIPHITFYHKQALEF